jgi:hypothetical protein
MTEQEDPRRQFSDEELIAAVRKHKPCGTQEVVEYLDGHHTRQAVLDRLRQLAENEDMSIETKLIGRVRVWYLGDE